MSEPGLETQLLTREEMDALVDALAEERAELERHDRAVTPQRRSTRARSTDTQALVRALETFAARHGRALSLAHQRRITLALISCSELRAHELAEMLLPVERLVSFELRPGETGWIVFGRPFFFTLLALACGAAPGAPLPPVPRRAYTRIEERFLLRFAEEVLSEIAPSWSPPLAARPPVIGIDSVEQLREREDEAVAVASFDLTGLGDVCRLRIVLPQGRSAATSEAPATAIPGDPQHAFRRLILEMTVALQVEIGTAEVPLARVAALQPGDVIPLLPADAGGLVVRVEGAPKFRAQAGSLGRALAVEVTDRL